MILKINLGEDKEIVCPVTLNVKWYYKREKLPPNVYVKTNFSHIVVISNVNYSDKGSLSCYGYDPHASLNILWDFYIIVYGELII